MRFRAQFTQTIPQSVEISVKTTVKSDFHECSWEESVYCISYCVHISSRILDITFNLKIYAEIQIVLYTRKVYAQS
jgi:hypothetical protein